MKTTLFLISFLLMATILTIGCGHKPIKIYGHFAMPSSDYKSSVFDNNRLTIPEAQDICGSKNDANYKYSEQKELKWVEIEEAYLCSYPLLNDLNEDRILVKLDTDHIKSPKSSCTFNVEVKFNRNLNRYFLSMPRRLEEDGLLTEGQRIAAQEEWNYLMQREKELYSDSVQVFFSTQYYDELDEDWIAIGHTGYVKGTQNTDNAFIRLTHGINFFNEYTLIGHCSTG